mmetsp:Transcript_9431/g.13839  ORF Transcript_9431/g.13839 Transcript_9431/m.13839 type:complete len:347 (-) Transcript_9431:212-1252(-)|eukprot:CAMPEP_0195517062 /NCGR_PEP_ID=MMETSP0794_2-20130614/9540_1 /TAXON_ID=515487 /ORGANISM="Stephanopyxis turris, Strain CCMP 815" /LENGTH=346 /DNA_ID=CAMNT_0040645805 /DNA_START=30 /DNA_END=1070 /DNA_ORIENTATION=-
MPNKAATQSIKHPMEETVPLYLGAGFGERACKLRAVDFGRPLPEKNDEHYASRYHNERRIRQNILLETLARLEDASPTARYHKIAQANTLRWKEEAEARASTTKNEGTCSACKLFVLRGDWGEVTRDMTKQFGVTFAALNMANAYGPGGGYAKGSIAQEENMFRRTDCHFSLDQSTVIDVTSGLYQPALTNLISGVGGRVYLDVSHPRVCIRGPEDRSLSNLGYPWLSDEEIFPFYELRSAALDLRKTVFDQDEMARRIGSQLDTLIESGVRHVVLSAFGCGAFLNPADKVAALYREELLKRAKDFDVIAFGIFHAGYGPDNFIPFAKAFSNCPEFVVSMSETDIN